MRFLGSQKVSESSKKQPWKSGQRCAIGKICFTFYFEIWCLIVVRCWSAPFYWSHISVGQDYQPTPLLLHLRPTKQPHSDHRTKSRSHKAGVYHLDRQKEFFGVWFKIWKNTKEIPLDSKISKNAGWFITMEFDTNATLMSPFLNYSPNMERPSGQCSVITFFVWGSI